jgi:hypothetical protein
VRRLLAVFIIMTAAGLLAAAGTVQGGRLVAESPLGRAAGAALEWMGGPGAGPLTGAMREVAGHEQIGRETAEDYARLSEIQHRRITEGDTPEVAAEAETISARLNQAYREDPFEAYKRAPAGEQVKTELIGGVVQGAGALALALSIFAIRGAGRSARPGTAPLGRPTPWRSARGDAAAPTSTAGQI